MVVYFRVRLKAIGQVVVMEFDIIMSLPVEPAITIVGYQIDGILLQYQSREKAFNRIAGLGICHNVVPIR